MLIMPNLYSPEKSYRPTGPKVLLLLLLPLLLLLILLLLLPLAEREPGMYRDYEEATQGEEPAPYGQGQWQGGHSCLGGRVS